VSVRETSGPAETEALGAELAAALRAGDVVLVRGDLGAGKTTLVRGAARALGVSDPVTSPTFGIGHRYRGAQVTVAHLDLYRLAGLADETPGLLEDYLEAHNIAFVEWPEEGSPELQGARIQVTLTHRGGDRRQIEIAELPRREAAGARVAGDMAVGRREATGEPARDGGDGAPKDAER
jgi:tRNA threonylcarbamoyladenosine biosynthesis protein TsaE